MQSAPIPNKKHNKNSDSTGEATASAPFQVWFRALICFSAAGTLAGQFNGAAINPVYALTIIGLAGYALLAYRLLQQRSGQDTAGLTLWLERIDAGIVGAVLTLIDYSPLPTLLFLTMVQFNALLTGGVRKMLRDNLAVAIGILVALLAHQPEWALSSKLEISAASIIGITTYFCLAAHNMYQQLQQANSAVRQLHKQLDVQRLRTYKLSRYLPQAVWEMVNQDKGTALLTERKHMTVFFSDIKDFSQLAEELEPEALTDLLNSYLTEMSKIITHHGGTLDKFMGDGMMVFFGDRDSNGAKEDAVNCVAMALAMRKKMKELQQVWFNQGIKKPMQIRIGINTGFCTVGTFGTSYHRDYTALGTQVNLASRLESAAHPGEILIAWETWSLIKEQILCRDKGEISAKGFSHPIKVYQVINFRKELGGNQSYFEHNGDGFSLHLDMDRIRSYDKERVLKALNEVSRALEDKVIV
jgi:class 3 adenylate cyclase